MAAYPTLEQADLYFETRLFGQSWANRSSQDRQAALLAASDDIDTLNYIGMKHAAWVQAQLTPCDEEAILTASKTQARQFPRGGDEEVPEDILKACYEIAFERIDGKDPTLEYEDLPTVSQGYSSVRRTYNRSYVQPHLQHGIVSPLAWRLLFPYLRNAENIKLSRV